MEVSEVLTPQRKRVFTSVNSIYKFLLTFILMEIFVGGGGRLINIGSVTIRMYIFFCALLFAVLILINRKYIHRSFIELSTLYTLTLILGILCGLLNGVRVANILLDVKPLIYFYSIIYFYLFIKGKEEIVYVIKLIKVSSLILGILYISIFGLINLNFISFTNFYRWASSTEEFFFRGEFAFFYKGFLYLCIGLFFYSWKKNVASKVAILIIIVAVLLTFTRGFIISLFLMYIFNIVVIKKKIGSFLIILIVSIFAASSVWSYVSNSEKLDRETSNRARVDQIKEVFQNINLTTLVIGNGFGQSISTREDLHLEISYLEILYKQGIIGLSFWILFLALIVYKYNKAVHFDKEISISFLLSSLFTFLLSFTNPFINNPLGITILILSFVCLHRVSKIDTENKFRLIDSKPHSIS